MKDLGAMSYWTFSYKLYWPLTCLITQTIIMCSLLLFAILSNKLTAVSRLTLVDLWNSRTATQTAGAQTSWGIYIIHVYSSSKKTFAVHKEVHGDWEGRRCNICFIYFTKTLHFVIVSIMNKHFSCCLAFVCATNKAVQLIKIQFWFLFSNDYVKTFFCYIFY